MNNRLYSTYKKLLKEEIHFVLNFETSNKYNTFLLTHSTIYFVAQKLTKKQKQKQKQKQKLKKKKTTKQEKSNHKKSKTEVFDESEVDDYEQILTMKELSGNGHHLFDLLSLSSLTRYNLTLSFHSGDITVETNEADRIIEEIYRQIRKITIGRPNKDGVKIELQPAKRKQRLEKIFQRIRKNHEFQPGHGFEDCYLSYCTMHVCKPDLTFLQYVRGSLKMSKRITLNHSSLSTSSTATCMKGNSTSTSNSKGKKRDHRENLNEGAGSGSGDLDTDDGGLSKTLMGITRDRCFSFNREIIKHINSNKSYNLTPIFQALKHNTWFHALILHDIKRKDLFSLIYQVISENKTLNTIILSGIGLNSDSVNEIGSKLLQNPNSRINKIDISNNSNINEKSVISFMETLSQRKTLMKSLSLRGLEINNKLPTLLIDKFSTSINLCNLITLDLSGNKLGKIGSSALVKFYRSIVSGNLRKNTNSENKNKKKEKDKKSNKNDNDEDDDDSGDGGDDEKIVENRLSTLILSDTDLRATSLLKEILENGLFTLKHLDISGNNLTEKDYELLGELIEQSFLLRVLRIARCNLTAIPGLRNLTNGIKNAQKISNFALDLSGNNLGQQGANLLALSLYNSNIIESLMVANCGFNNRAVSLIVASFLNNNYLKTLNLACNIEKNEDASLTCLELSYLLKKSN